MTAVGGEEEGGGQEGETRIGEGAVGAGAEAGVERGESCDSKWEAPARWTLYLLTVSFIFGGLEITPEKLNSFRAAGCVSQGVSDPPPAR